MTATIGPPTPVEINQLTEEFKPVLDLYREVAPRRVLEIGTAAGGTLYHWLQNAQRDPWGEGPTIVSVDIDTSQVDQHTIEDEWAAGGAECILIQGDTATPWTQDLIKPHAPFNWVFIDGCHEYQAARSDWEAFRPMCAEGAYVLFHDIALVRNYPTGATAGVKDLWRELQAEGHWTREIRAEPNLTEYGVGVLRLS